MKSDKMTMESIIRVYIKRRNIIPPGIVNILQQEIAKIDGRRSIISP